MNGFLLRPMNGTLFRIPIGIKGHTWADIHVVKSGSFQNFEAGCRYYVSKYAYLCQV